LGDMHGPPAEGQKENKNQPYALKVERKGKGKMPMKAQNWQEERRGFKVCWKHYKDAGGQDRITRRRGRG